MSSLSDNDDDPPITSNYTSPESPSHVRENGAGFVTPAIVTQSQEVEIHSARDSDPQVSVDDNFTTSVDSPSPFVNFASPNVPSPSRLSSPLFRRRIDGAEENKGRLRKGRQQLHRKRKQKRQKRIQQSNRTTTINLNDKKLRQPR
jgi:hypothetical protein